MFTMINDYLSWLKDNLSDEVTMSIMIAVGVALVTILIVMFFGVWKFRSKVLPSRSGGPKKPRFRKRDKVLFYGRKMLRKVRSFTRNTVGPGVYGALSSSRGKSKNKLVMKLAKSPSFRLLQSRRNSSLPQLKHKEPPQSFLDTDSSEMDESEQRLPPEVLYMLRSTRVFGHFEKPLFLELVKQMESLSVPNGEYLFKIGDADEFIYVLQSGRIHVFITEESTEYFVKEVKPGDSIHSLLSILDVLTGHPQPYKTVCAKAVEDTTVLRLPAKSFLSLFERFPESLVRIIQIIMIRLQRVTFTALHNYLGLSSQLINHKKQFDLRNLSISALIPNQQSSPSRKKGSAGSQSIQSGALGDSDSGLKQEAKRQPEGTDVDRKSSDFDAACIRARAVPKSDEFVETGSLGSRKSRKSSESSSISQRFEGRNAEILELAKKDLIAIMKLKNENALDGKMVLKTFRSGSNLVKQGDPDAQLIFVITGQLLVLQQKIDSQEKEAFLFSAQRGEIVGALAVLTGEPSFFTMRAKTDIMVVMISKNSFYEMMRVQPDIVLSVAHTTLARIAPFVRQIDFALDWMMVEAGKALFRQGDISDSIFITLTGRFRSVITLASGKKELVAEYGRGELVGIVEVLTDTERTTTIMAIRDTECAKLPAELLNLIKRKYPQIVTRLIHLLGQRILGHLQTGRSNVTPLGDHLEGVENKSNSNLATIAVFPTSKDVPLTSFTLELQNHLRTIGTVTRLTSDIIKANLGSSAFDAVHEFRLFNWLGHQEDMHRMTLYQCDYTMTKWTKHCVRQADSILIVALADKDSAVSELEKHLANIAVRAQKELILLHKEDADKPRGTIDWLNARDWCSSHHHIRCPKRIFSRKPVERILEVYDRMMQQEPDRQCDFGRLARFLTGTSIGLVLGGGGARGFAHVGMIKALIEAGVPIDIVGGTSMGAFIGALWCDETSITRVIQKAREWAHDMGSIWKKIFDLTYPVASIFSGGAFNHLIEKSLEDRQVEDLWIPYFCISTDLSASKMRVHTSGSLWRYVRASMSLSGYMPPLCDPVDGHYLLDGGYVNNLPADVMKSMGAQSIFAVDVGSQDDTNLTNYGDKLNGWWLLWKRWNPWAQPIRILDMNEIQSRLAYVGGTRQLEMIKNSDYCEYIRPPIDKYYTLQFGSFDEITEVGYHHGKTLLSGWHKGGLIHDLFREKSKEKTAKSAQHKKELGIPEMSKFTDLAELVSKIDEPKDDVTFYAPVSDDSSDLTDSLEEDGYEEEIIEEEEGEVEEDSHIADDESEPEVRNRNSRMKTTPLKYAGRE